MADDIVIDRQSCIAGCLCMLCLAWEERKRLTDEVERLRAAGDAVVDALVNLSVGGLPEDMNAFISAIDAYEEARRG